MTGPVETIRVPGAAPVTALFTTRRGGVSTGPAAGLNLSAGVGDDPAAVAANRAALAAHVRVDARRVATVTQVHGAGVHVVDAPPPPLFAEGGHGGPEADGMVTDLPGVPLLVLAADCVPVLVWRRDGTRVGAAHAGWRGLVAGVVERTVAAVGDPATCAAAVGPAIGACCYPVSGEVRDAFTGRFGAGVVHGAAVDVAGAAVRALTASGVPRGAVWTAGLCTACDPDRFHSFRRDGDGTGRQAGMVWR